MKISDWLPKGIQVPPSAKRDVVLLAALFLFNLFNFSTWVHLGRVATSPWVFLPWLYGLVALFPLVWRNRAPITVFATQWVLAAAAWPFMSEYMPVVGIPVALYAVAFHCSRRASSLALTASLIPSGLDAYSVSFRASHSTSDALVALISNALFLALMAVGAWFLGRSIGASQREQERSRQAKVLADERRKIARELHDIVSHSVTVILLQANGAACIADADLAHITDSDFAEIKQSLAHITSTGSQTMAELRRLLGVLETGDAAVDDAEGLGQLRPQPGLADLPALLDSLRATGMPIAAQVQGIPQDLDPSLDLTAYRIVQEGLTNILKHAGKDANPRLLMVWKPYKLVIHIDNDIIYEDASRKSAPSFGRGLLGLRERVHAVGGILNAGPYKSGYRLSATLPFSTSETSLTPDAYGQSYEDQGKVSA